MARSGTGGSSAASNATRAAADQRVASWNDFRSDAPELAARVEPALRRGKHMTMATLRRDGAPRISGTELELEDHELYVGMMPRSRKALDLQRDPRVAIHGPTADPPDNPSEWIGEAKLGGRAIELPRDDDAPHRFRIEIDEVVLTHLNNAGDRLVIESWHPGRGVQVVERE